MREPPKRRHRSPWRTEPAAVWRLEHGAAVVVDGFDYVVERIERDGLTMAPDGEGFLVRVALAHPSGRRGRPRSFPAPTLELTAADPIALRVEAPADWRGF